MRRTSLSFITLFGLSTLVALPVVAAPRADLADSAWVTEPTQIWTEPGKFGTPIARLEPGLKLDVLTYSSSKSWVKLKTPEGREGWVPTRFTTFAEPIGNVAGAVEQASESVGEAGAATEGAEGQEGEGGDRFPASAGGVRRVRRHPAAGSKSGFLLGFRLEYVNQLNRAKASGFGIGTTGMARIHENWAIGGGFDYKLFFESATSTQSFSVDRITSSLFPHAAAAFLMGGFSMELGVGVEIDITKITTKNNATFPPTVDYANSGTDTSLLLGVRLTPGYRFALGGTASLGVHALYEMLFNLSRGYGKFPSVNPSKNFQNVIGGGLTAAFDL